MENDWALVVGINHYPYAVGGLAPLTGAARDAEKFFKWVIDPLGGAVPDDGIHSVLLTSPEKLEPNADPIPVLSSIQGFIDKMKNRLVSPPERRLYIYLSGHGISPISEEAVRHAALLMANTRPPRDWPNVPGNVWAEGARNAALFREVVLIMDCCRDLQQRANVGTHPFPDATDDGKVCHLVEMYAADWGSQAREAPFGDEQKMMGIFTHSLLEVLWAGRMNGRLLKDSVLKHLSRQALPRPPAKPDIRTDEELLQIVFNEAAPVPMSPVTVLNQPPPAPPNIWMSPPEGGRLVKVDTSGWECRNDQWLGTLTPGLYQIILPSGEPFLFAVYAGLSETVDVLNPEVAR
jgi:hypothetical protein